jgi:molecular chaperone HtpG
MSTTVVLPKKITKIIEKSPEYGNLINAMKVVSPIYADNRMFFFEEFTNHGLDHINEVLSASEDIIAQSSLNALTQKDVLVYVCSVLLHDIGMQLSLEGFKKLISGSLDESIIRDFDSKTWEAEWEDFLLKAKKYDEKTINNIFGSDIPADFVVPNPDINTLSGNNIGPYERKLIGEFIRINHARLAHEAAIGGFPGVTTIDLLDGIDSETRNIIGLIARSHNLEIRGTFAYLKKLESKLWHSIYQVPVIYLMVLLRLSDLIQIHAKRADKNILKYRRLYNSVSIKEWALHESVANIYTFPDNDDPESIYIRITPKSSEIYLKARKLLDYIQFELDLSWAILGEVYAKHGSYKKLILKYRRINSNIDDIDNFKNTVNYIPKKIIFDTTRELQKLLIAPLYGNNPSYGVRELLQNAVDACRTRSYYAQQHNIEYSPEIHISISPTDDKQNHVFAIRDNGIGMTLDTITDYFLKAGASFRKSYAWQKDFVGDDGISNVQRTGRFGVGVLAVFLLGEKITVTTNNIHESSPALSFEATLDSDQIEVNKVNAETGTFIEVILSTHALQVIMQQYPTYGEVYGSYGGLYGRNSAPWNKWYKLSEPTLTITVPEEWGEAQPNHTILGLFDELPMNTYTITPLGFNKVIWTYYNRAVHLSCNGFVIPGGYSIAKLDYRTITALPNVTVFDYNANLPLTLNRNYLENDKLPFEEELMEEVYKDILAYALALKAEITNKTDIGINFGLTLHAALKDARRYEVHEKSIYSVNRLVFTRNGFTFSLPKCFENASLGTLIQLWISADNKGTALNIKKNDKISLVYYEHGNIKIKNKESHDRFDALMAAIDDNNNNIYGGRRSSQNSMLANNFNLKNKVVVMRSNLYNEFTNRYGARGLRDSAKTIIIGEYSCFNITNSSNNRIINEDLKIINSIIASEIGLDMFIINNIDSITHDDTKENTIFQKVIDNYLGENPVIPYEMHDREQSFPKAFTELAKNINFYSNSFDKQENC